MKIFGWPSLLRNVRKLGSGQVSRKTPCHLFHPRCESLEDRIALDDNSAGPNGIDARVLGLTGQGVHIGQVEAGRPGLRTGGFDSNANSHPHVTPSQVFLRNGPAEANKDVHYHATGVAGVVIANGTGADLASRGVARNASLHSSAARVANTTDYEQMLLSMDQVSLWNPTEINDIVAINISAGLKLSRLPKVF